MRTRFILVMAILASSAIAATGTHANTIARQSPSCAASVPRPSQPASGLATEANAFGFHLLPNLMAGAGGKNVFISPTSIELALAMAYNGSAGETRQAMAATLGLAGSQATIRRQAATLLRELNSTDPHARIAIANSLWAQKGFPFHQQFTRQVRRAYGAKITNLNLRSPSAPSTVNDWVSCATHQTIRKIVDRIPPEMVMYLINAVYFKGDWSSPFQSANTHPQTFTQTGGTTSQVPMMSQEGNFPYLQGQGFQAISLPYGGGRYSMVVVLPRRGTSLARFGSQLTTANWHAWTARLHMVHGSIALPRFHLQNTFDLVPVLSAMGMGPAFARTANFSRLCVQSCRISQVLHKTFLNVYEKGTVASAVTSVGVSPTAIQFPKFTMTVDHPFYVMIRDHKTGSILFTGAINTV